MKKSIIIVFAMFGLLFSMSGFIPAFAAECGGVETSIVECDNTGVGSIREIILNVINILSIGVGIVGVIGISIVGIQYMTAGGSEEKTRMAKQRMFNIVLGLGIYAIMWAGLQWLTSGFSVSGEREVTAVTLGASSVEMNVGETRTLSPALTPLDADNTSFTWVSADQNVATVDDRGKVTAKAPGNSVITVTTSNGHTASTTIKVVASNSGGSGNSGSGGSTASGGSNTAPADTDRYRLGTALAVRHAANNGNIDTVREAVNKKYWGVECDLQYYNGTLMCYHDSSYRNNNGTSATFAETVSVCKAGGTKVVIDLKTSGEAGLAALGNYIKTNNLQDWVVVQTSNQNSMRLLNGTFGGKLEYWGLVMNTQSTLESLINNASAYQDLGMTTVNVPLVAGNYQLGSNDNIRRLQSAGYSVAAFTWVSFSQSAIENYDSLGVKYLMTNRLQ